MAEKGHNTRYVKNIAAVSMCTAFIIISSWLSVPFSVNFTLQTFSIFIICFLFDFKIAFSSIVVYMMIGIIGVPVFSGFGAGISAIVAPTGGFLLSFLLFPFVIKLFNFKSNLALRIFSMFVCMLICYTLGTLWYYFGYSAANEMDIIGILSICVFPFIIPDIVKILLVSLVYGRLSKIKFMK